MKFYRNLNELIENKLHHNNNQTVWRGEDGSYAVGETFPIEAEESETEYIEAGKVKEYDER